jgi:hypothetical protein
MLQGHEVTVTELIDRKVAGNKITLEVKRTPIKAAARSRRQPQRP